MNVEPTRECISRTGSAALSVRDAHSRVLIPVYTPCDARDSCSAALWNKDLHTPSIMFCVADAVALRKEAQHQQQIQYVNSLKKFLVFPVELTLRTEGKDVARCVLLLDKTVRLSQQLAKRKLFDFYT